MLQNLTRYHKRVAGVSYVAVPLNMSHSSVMTKKNRSQPASNRFSRCILTITLCIIASYLFWPVVASPYGSKPSTPPTNRLSSIPVTTAKVVQGDLPMHLTGLGTVTPLHMVTVKSRVEGELLRVSYTEGQRVHKGDLLAEIDPRPYSAQLMQNEGQLARDQALLENAKVDWQRYRDLLGKDSIAAQQVATQKALVAQYQAAIQMDQGQIAATRLQLDYSRITAPISGRVGLRKVDPGNIVRAGDAEGLVVITQTTPISVLFTLPEDRLPALLDGMRKTPKLTVEARDRSATQVLATGQLLAVDNQIDPATGTIRLKAVFPNTDENLFANQFVNVQLNLAPLRDVPIIPAAALVHGASGDFVYIATAEGKARMQSVTPGARDGERITVLDGLKAGDDIIVEGMDRLREGSSISIIRAQTTPSVPAS
ncbi:MAG: MdtA/MuxA family multidrug efflux RND transporter periplasmic adaptor subunit [Methylococcaceae bacterium]